MSLDSKKFFQAIYLAFLGDRQGPKVGWFLASLDRDFVKTRLLEASTSLHVFRMIMVHKIYLSGPLFSAAEIAWAGKLSALLGERLENTEVIWPHEIVPEGAEPEHIFRANLQALNHCDLMVAILDGAQVDDGTCLGDRLLFWSGQKDSGDKDGLSACRRVGKVKGQPHDRVRLRGNSIEPGRALFRA